jgi:hypothetical protein
MRGLLPLVALIPATILVIGGYFVLFISNRSEGTHRAFGKYLAFWCFTLAGLVVLGALAAVAAGGGMRRERLRDTFFMRAPPPWTLPLPPGAGPRAAPEAPVQPAPQPPPEQVPAPAPLP